MKLYYSPGACSQSPHIVARELGLPIELKKVNTKDKSVEGGGDFWKVNPRGYVPALELDNGERLTEGPAIVQYLADQVPEKKLAPPSNSFERVRLQEWLNFITAELHKGFGPLFHPSTPEDYKPLARQNLITRLTFVDQALGKSKKPFLLGDTFTVADAYLFTVANWAGFVGLDLESLSNVGEYQGRVRERPAVTAALRAEGLLG